MAKIRFSNGVVVNFDGNPTQQDIEEIANKLGINKPQQTSNQKKSLLDRASGLSEKTLGKARDFLFGTSSKVMGNTIGSFAEGVEKLTRPKSLEQKIDPALAAQLLKRGKTPEEIKNSLTVKTKDTFSPPVKPFDIAFTALELYPGGGMATKALKKLPGEKIVSEVLSKIPSGLKSNAVKQYSEALGATTKELKAKTAKVVPELLKQNKIIPSFQRMAESSEKMIEKAGQAVRKAENALPVFNNKPVKNIIENAVKERNKYIINGKIIDKGAVKAIDNVVETITQFGNEIAEPQLIKIRRILDKSVKNANKNFTKDEGLTLATEVKEGMANSIRNVLNSGNPKLAKANKEFSLWSDVNKIVNATMERRSTQTGGLSRFIGPLTIGGGGLATGDPINAVIGYFGTQAALKLFQSPGYKTISAVSKNKLAEYLISGNIKAAILLTNKLLSGLNNETNK